MTSNADPRDRPPAKNRRPLTELGAGERGRLCADSMRREDRELLAALGLVDRSRVRLCKAGTPWIVQVQGTRIGLSDDVARRLQIVPELAASDPAASEPAP